ncbi:hypothetical protein M752DRAFT_134021 [Aspergillus phoenicis ATCC 13157]|uniref:Uncharacterized protein n=2 Tax=Aspergillus TaxID=5052 RepID=A0A370PSN1_ASPPH|nr:hypothetical protein M747DRAFT_133256 [Aspergillus niger ATCC 13496]RDK45217.1 hypothetical protein M752DRAFT_134021 [Aspergillus phoenicis ATCC 13157]
MRTRSIKNDPYSYILTKGTGKIVGRGPAGVMCPSVSQQASSHSRSCSGIPANSFPGNPRTAICCCRPGPSSFVRCGLPLASICASPSSIEICHDHTTILTP